MTDYYNDPAWADVTPIYNSDQENSVVPISYSPHFRLVFGYLRAVLASEEVSERAFELTTDAADANPANYTVWQYRRKLLKALNKDLAEELKFTSTVIEDNPKNYQVWHHRRMLVEWLGSAEGELRFIDRILTEDSKNYHAWQHRHWVVETFKLWEGELSYAGKLLEDDVRNNSAWNYRYFLISSTTGFTPEVAEGEIKLALAAIQTAPHNESSWNYLSGIMLHSNAKELKPKVEEFCEKLYSTEKSKSSHLLAFMADEALGKAEAGDGDAKGKAISLLDELKEIDPIRRHYWESLKI